MFGGSFNADHVVVTGAADDSLDMDLGFSGDLQYVLIHHDSTPVGDNGFEVSNGGDFAATPRTNPRVANATVVGAGTGDKSTGVFLKEQTNMSIWNSILGNYALDATTMTPLMLILEDDETCSEWTSGNIAIDFNIAIGDVFDATPSTCDIASLFGANNLTADADFTGLALDATWGAPSVQPSPSSASVGNGAGSALPSTFDQVDYIGAVDPLASEDWTQAAWINYTP